MFAEGDGIPQDAVGRVRHDLCMKHPVVTDEVADVFQDVEYVAFLLDNDGGAGCDSDEREGLQGFFDFRKVGGIDEKHFFSL